MKSQTKLITIKLKDICDRIEKFNNLRNNELRVQKINFDDGETKVVVKAKLFLVINKDTAKLASQIEDIKINLKYLDQDTKQNC